MRSQSLGIIKQSKQGGHPCQALLCPKRWHTWDAAVLPLTSSAADAPVKLIDFSLAAFFHQPTEPGGTPDFVAPELLMNPEACAARGCGGEVDMWATGVLLFFLLSGQVS